MISDDRFCLPLKNLRGAPQYFHNMLLDVFVKTRQFGICTLFLTCSAAESQWTEIVQVGARQYG